MDLLERYLRQIRRYLPFKEREETINELQSLILDQLDEMVASGIKKEEALYSIISEMGDPREVAERYNERGPMISREMEPIMTLVMKIVSITLPLVLLFADSLRFVTEEQDFTFTEFLLNLAYMIPNAMYALVIAIGMIFIIFALIERYLSPKFHVEVKTFVPELLPELPKKVFKVSVLESVLTILFTIAALYLFNYQQGLIRVWYDGGSYPLLTSEFDQVIPFLNIAWFISIVLHVYYLYRMQKSLVTKTIEFIAGVYGGVIAILLGTRNIFNDIIVNGYDLNIIPTIIRYVLIFVGIAAIIGSIVEYVKLYINLDKLEDLSKQKK